MFLQLLILFISLVALYGGAEISLTAAEKIGKSFGLSPLIIGLLIVGFGTSLPEFFVSQIAAIHHHPEIAMGNIVGSNIANLFLVMGITGVLVPLHLVRSDIKKQLQVHIMVTLLLGGVLLYRKLDFVTLIIFLLIFLGYIYLTFWLEKKKEILIEEEEPTLEKVEILSFVKLLVGFILLYLGGDWLVKSGSELGRIWGISEYVVSAIFIAFGTSFPELMTALVACYKKKHTDLIIGNIIGSNIFNILFVMGSLGVHRISFDSKFMVELTILLVAAIYLMILSFRRHNFSRRSGIFFLCSYVGIICYWIN